MMRSLPISQFLIGVFSLLTLIMSITLYGGISKHGAGFMPTILSVLLLVFTAIDSFVHMKQAKKKLAFSMIEIKALLLIITSISLFVLLISYLGFLICSSLLLFSLMTLRNPENFKLNIVYSVIASILINYVFGQLLMVDLPQGIWF